MPTWVALPIAQGCEGTDTNFARRLLEYQMARIDVADMTQSYCDTLQPRSKAFARP